jgi:hypothetical protein
MPDYFYYKKTVAINKEKDVEKFKARTEMCWKED